jgi:uroporphyrinogen decarboxylase
MTSKERVLTVLDHKAADRVPVTNRYTPEIASELARIVGVRSADSFDLEVALGHDMLCMKEIGIVNSYKAECNRMVNDEYVDEYRIVKKLVDYDGGSYLEIVHNPLEKLEAWDSYEFPDPDRQPTLLRQYEDFERSITKYGKSHAIVGGVTCTILEGAEMLRGMSRLFMDFVENEAFVHELMDQLMHYHFKVGKKLIELGVDILYIGDDAGAQLSMLISPDMWRRYLKPRYDYLFCEWRKLRKDIIFAFHTDGYVEPIIPDFVDIGLDILNPVQPGCMNDERLKRAFGDKLSFWGGINVQKTIPFGTAADVVAEVREKLKTYGTDGGYIISCSHNVQPNIRSVDNTMVYYWACRRYGEYRNGKPGA